jgi:hypothetical protein
VQNWFGYNGRMYQIRTASCNPCDANTYTRDVLTGTPAVAGYTAPEDCLVMPGWGIDTSLIAVPCKAGEGCNLGFTIAPVVLCVRVTCCQALAALSVCCCWL